MKLNYFPDTDTLCIELKDANWVETRVIDENTLLDMDGEGNLLAITVEHASQRADLNSFVFNRVVA